MKRKLIILITCIFFIFFQFGIDVRAISSVRFANNDYNTEQLTIIGNKFLIISKNNFAEKLIQKRIDNSFNEIMFTGAFPCELNIEVYTNWITWKIKHRSFLVICYIEDSEHFCFDIQ